MTGFLLTESTLARDHEFFCKAGLTQLRQTHGCGCLYALSCFRADNPEKAGRHFPAPQDGSGDSFAPVLKLRNACLLFGPSWEKFNEKVHHTAGG